MAPTVPLGSASGMDVVYVMQRESAESFQVQGILSGGV